VITRQLIGQKPLTGYTKALLSERGRPGPPPFEQNQLVGHSFHLGKNEWVLFDGAGDGRAPTEELSCIRLRSFCSMNLVEERAELFWIKFAFRSQSAADIDSKRFHGSYCLSDVVRRQSTGQK